MLDELKKIGLSEHEAKVYLALLELGSATAQEIANKSGIKRTTIYMQIEALMKMGLVTSFEKETSKGGAPKTYFRAEDPEHLHRLVEKEKSTMKEKEAALKETIPDLEKLFLSSGERPRVRFFEGIEGLRAIQDEVFKIKAPAGETIKTVASPEDVIKTFPEHPTEYAARRIKKGIMVQLIYTSSKGAFLKDFDKKDLRESRYISPDKFPFSCDIGIYGDSVAISSLRDKPFGIIIENKGIANSMKTMFSLAWEAAEKYQK
ncbi:MAG: helix-turn-helix domain-containing protein [bacterium]|nr:helix-turn-helix domain-containing protein [bacterium]